MYDILIYYSIMIIIITDYYYDDLEISKIPERSLVSSSIASLLDLPKYDVLINKEFLFNGKTGSLAYIWRTADR